MQENNKNKDQQNKKGNITKKRRYYEKKNKFEKGIYHLLLKTDFKKGVNKLKVKVHCIRKNALSLADKIITEI